MRCEECGRWVNEQLFKITKQEGGNMYFRDVCQKCHQEHEKQLEAIRENFRRQFGDR